MTTNGITDIATGNRARLLADLRERLKAQNCELLEDQTNDDGDDHLYVLDRRIGKLVSVCASLKDTYDWVVARERAADSPARPAETAESADERLFDLKADVWAAAEKIRDALRWIELCHAALDHGEVNDTIQRTLGLDVELALSAALEALGARTVDKEGTWHDHKRPTTSEVSHG